MSEVEDYLSHAQKVKIESNKATAAVKKAYRNKRGAIAGSLMNRRVAKTLAAAMSCLQQNLVQKAEEVGLPCVSDIHTLVAGGDI